MLKNEDFVEVKMTQEERIRQLENQIDELNKRHTREGDKTSDLQFAVSQLEVRYAHLIAQTSNNYREGAAHPSAAALEREFNLRKSQRCQ